MQAKTHYNPNRKTISKLKHATKEVYENWRDRFWWRNRILTRIVGPIQRALSPPGIDVYRQDWDNLLLLDACRADAFERAFDVSSFDEYRRVRSRGSATPEWLRNNFAGRDCGDTVYVSANPWVSKNGIGAFHRVIDLWLDEFDEELGTVLPHRVNDRAKQTQRKHPDKRLIVHYNQPHGPYVGAKQIPEERQDGFETDRALAMGSLAIDDVKGAYEANVEYVRNAAIELANQLEGKTIITADHGELFGKRIFGIRTVMHPPGLRDPDLITVPWAVLDADAPRKEITSDNTTAPDEVDTDLIDERLTALGYRP